VVIADNTVTGAGVVLAQRVEQLAQPGGVCLQGAVYEAVPRRMPFQYEKIGEQTLKGFEEPVRVYAAQLKEGESIPAPEVSRHALFGWKPAVAAVVIIAVIVLGWFRPWGPQEEPASPERMAFVLPDQPSIAVLPFTNMSSDPEQEYFADGMTEDLITDLSKLSGLFVIARNSTFTYKGKAVKIGQVAEELGVRYVLEGSVRRSGDQIRINAQLIDALSGGHVWAERYDSSFSDIFALQDNITQKIVSALAVNLTAEDLGKQDHKETISVEAYDAFLRGWTHYQLKTAQDAVRALPYFEKAIALDPNYGRAHAALAEVYWNGWSSEWARELGISYQEADEKMKYYLKEAMNNPTPLAYQVASKIFSTIQKRWDEAIDAAEHAIALDTNSSRSYATMARLLFKVGRSAEALDYIKKAMRLDPKADYVSLLGNIQYHAKRFDESAATLLRATKRNPDGMWTYIRLAAAYGHLGREQEAASAIETFNEFRAKRGQGAYTLGHIGGWSFKEETDRELLVEGLRKAGLPEGNVTVTSGSVSPENVEGATTIGAVRAKTLYDRDVPFIDVRDEVDWNAGHISDAVHLEAFNVFSETRLSNIVGKNEEVVIHCYGPVCARSAAACVSAVSWGFTKVYYFREGFPAWKAAGYPVNVPEG
jgi:TolB-like protein/rhodanese-related sulfurtransferase